MASSIGPDSVLRLALAARVRRFRGKMFVATAEEAYELDSVAEYIFRLVDGKSTIKEIAARVAADFDVSLEQATGDAVELLQSLVEPGMVEVVA
jgi:pyrroloquinoline quinone biosynthesis protein D